MNVGDALTVHVEDRLDEVADKYFSRSIDSNATFTKEGHLYRTDLSMHPNQGVNLQSRGEADDPYAAFEMAAERIEKQLRRYKRRLKSHNNLPQRDVALELARESTISADSFPDEEPMENGVDVDADQPVIIAETRKQIPRVSVSDAVMLMDLADATAFMFRNVKTDQHEVVYRRADGHIGWISPGQSEG